MRREAGRGAGGEQPPHVTNRPAACADRRRRREAKRLAKHPHPRPLYLTAKHFFKGYPGFSMLLPKIGAVPAHPANVHRLLYDEGQLVLVFPEGRKGTEKLYKERRDVAQRFLLCFVEATKKFIDEPAFAEKYVRESMLKNQITADDYQEAIGNSPFSYDMSLEHAQITVDLMAKYGVGKMANPPKAADWVKLDLLAEAKRQLKIDQPKPAPKAPAKKAKKG